MTDLTTREFCARCNSVSAVGFSVPSDVWTAVAGRHWSDSILCIRCFAALGDEKGVAWEVAGIDFYAVSLATHREARREPHGWRDAGRAKVLAP